MKNTEIERKIKELELELSNLKSSLIASNPSEQVLIEPHNKFQSLSENNMSYLSLFNVNTFQSEFVNTLNEKSPEIPKDKLNDSHLNDIFGEQTYQFALKYIDEIKSGKSVSFEYTFDNALGKRWIQVNYFPVIDAKGGVTSFAVFNFDITGRKKAEEEMRKMKESLELLNHRLEEIREEENGLIAIELHDRLGQSLTALKIDANWLKEKIVSDSEVSAKMQGIIELINSLIKDVQRISSELHPAILDDIGLAAVIKWYCQEFEKRTGIKCLLNLDDMQLSNKKKNLALYRILQEALTNVIRHANAKKVNINLFKEENSIILEVIDDGLGFEHKKIDSHKSIGFIGMQERIKKYNGKIDIFSKLNKGTKICISVPFNNISEEKIEIENSVSVKTNEIQIENLKILIVEDDDISYSLLSRFTQKLSKEILYAKNGFEAVVACQDNHDIDLVLMDIKMPVMDGYEATRQIRQFNKDVIIIAQTAYAFSNDREMITEAGCNDYIYKPINKDFLFELIKKHCNK